MSTSLTSQSPPAPFHSGTSGIYWRLDGSATMVAKATLNKITHILKAEGCTEIFLFGSHATGTARPHSDIDIGVKGLPPARFLATYARLDREIQEKIDFVDFDEQTAFFQFLSDIGEIKKIG